MISLGGFHIFVGKLVWMVDKQYGDCLVEVTKFMTVVSLLTVASYSYPI